MTSPARSAFCAVLLGALVACDPVGELRPSQGDGPDGQRRCAEADAPNGCDDACTADSLCPAGLHCLDGSCDAVCWDELPCDDGLVCDRRGRCVELLADAGPPPDAPDGPGPDACAAVTVELEPTVPNVLFIVDRSGSMNEPFRGGDDDRWDVLVDGLFREPGDESPGDPGGIVRQLDGVVPFGASLYTKVDDDDTCPLLREVGISLGAADDLAELFDDHPPPGGADTPTGDSIAAIHAALPREELEGPVVFVVATDGEPDRCEDPDAHDEESRRLSIDAVQAAYADDIRSFMISLARIDQRHMQDLANAGAGLFVPADEDEDYPSGTELARFYDPQNSGELADALTEIVDTVQSCELAVDGELVVSRACEGTLLVDGAEVACDDPGGGWRALDESRIELLGGLCDDLKAGRVRTIAGSFPCDSVILR